MPFWFAYLFRRYYYDIYYFSLFFHYFADSFSMPPFCQPFLLFFPLFSRHSFSRPYFRFSFICCYAITIFIFIFSFHYFALFSFITLFIDYHIYWFSADYWYFRFEPLILFLHFFAFSFSFSLLLVTLRRYYAIFAARLSRFTPAASLRRHYYFCLFRLPLRLRLYFIISPFDYFCFLLSFLRFLRFSRRLRHFAIAATLTLLAFYCLLLLHYAIFSPLILAYAITPFFIFITVVIFRFSFSLRHWCHFHDIAAIVDYFIFMPPCCQRLRYYCCRARLCLPLRHYVLRHLHFFIERRRY